MISPLRICGWDVCCSMLSRCWASSRAYFGEQDLRLFLFPTPFDGGWEETPLFFFPASCMACLYPRYLRSSLFPPFWKISKEWFLLVFTFLPPRLAVHLISFFFSWILGEGLGTVDRRYGWQGPFSVTFRLRRLPFSLHECGRPSTFNRVIEFRQNDLGPVTG